MPGVVKQRVEDDQRHTGRSSATGNVAATFANPPKGAATALDQLAAQE